MEERERSIADSTLRRPHRSQDVQNGLPDLEWVGQGMVGQRSEPVLPSREDAVRQSSHTAVCGIRDKDTTVTWIHMNDYFCCTCGIYNGCSQRERNGCHTQ